MAKKKNDRLPWTILGRNIGTASGWDHADAFVMQLYDFEPADDVDLPSGTLCIDFEKGIAETFDDEGKTLISKDIVLALFDVLAVPSLEADRATEQEGK